ncbi:MAG: hypothetical protein NC300_03735 [Bacteroidales bacterium]|nr:hypothetical protein [Clostridium sp.]MCM1203231.1 hypothetical protein [Bacteroidales bacterium]
MNLMPEGDKFTVWDKENDIETYFYKDRSDADDKQGEAMWKFTGVLDIATIHTNSVAVKLSDLIEAKLNKLKDMDLFNSYDLEDIMLDILNSFAGNISENWMEQFVEILTC